MSNKTTEQTEAQPKVSPDDLLTPYAAHVVANELFRAAGLAEIRPQMVYNYTTGQLNKGKKAIIPTELVAREGGGKQVRVRRSAVAAWAEGYIARKQANADKVKAELNGESTDAKAPANETETPKPQAPAASGGRRR